MANKKKELSFEDAVKALEQTVKSMESGDLGLDDLLADFEKGIGLLRLCEQKLAEAEGRIEVLTKAEISKGSAAKETSDADNDEADMADGDLVPSPENEPELPF